MKRERGRKQIMRGLAGHIKRLLGFTKDISVIEDFEAEE